MLYEVITFMLPLSLFERAQWQAPTLMTFSMMLFLGVFCSVIAFLLYRITSYNVCYTKLLRVLRAIFSSRKKCCPKLFFALTLFMAAKVVNSPDKLHLMTVKCTEGGNRGSAKTK